MRFSYTIIYVPNVTDAIEFYERAFGLTRYFISDEGLYGALDTGGTKLAFLGYEQADTFGHGYTKATPDGPPPGFEVAFAVEDCDAAYAAAVEAGAMPAVPPADKPWGERIAYVRDLNGILVELAQPAASE